MSSLTASTSWVRIIHLRKSWWPQMTEVWLTPSVCLELDRLSGISLSPPLSPSIAISCFNFLKVNHVDILIYVSNQWQFAFPEKAFLSSSSCSKNQLVSQCNKTMAINISSLEYFFLCLCKSFNNMALGSTLFIPFMNFCLIKICILKALKQYVRWVN